MKIMTSSLKSLKNHQQEVFIFIFIFLKKHHTYHEFSEKNKRHHIYHEVFLVQDITP
jgi:hypothetical protein